MGRVRLLHLIGILVTWVLLAGCELRIPEGRDPQARTELFYEDFEAYPVGGPPLGGWLEGWQSYYEKVIQYPSNHKLYLEGPIQGPDVLGGVYYTFADGGIRPTYVRFKTHPYPIRDAWSLIGFFVLGGRLEGSDACCAQGIRFHFVHGPDGTGSLSSNYAVNYPPPGDEYMAIDRSWEIEFTDIDWNAYPVPLFDLWVNGFLIGECLPFVFPVESFERLDLFNQETGAVHFDEILMAKADLTHRCPQVGEPPEAPDWQPLPPPPATLTFTPTPTPTPLTFTVSVNAFCRFGPGTDYPVVTAFTPGEQLTVDGQNADGSWFWSDAVHCWISAKVGELPEPPQPLPMYTPPPTSTWTPVPTPTWTPSPTGEPGRPQGCYEEMEEDVCVEHGGTWVIPAVSSPYCDCP